MDCRIIICSTYLDLVSQNTLLRLILFTVFAALDSTFSQPMANVTLIMMGTGLSFVATYVETSKLGTLLMPGRHAFPADKQHWLMGSTSSHLFRNRGLSDRISINAYLPVAKQDKNLYCCPGVSNFALNDDHPERIQNGDTFNVAHDGALITSLKERESCSETVLDLGARGIVSDSEYDTMW